MTAKIGGVDGAVISTDGVYQETIVATGIGNLQFNKDSSFVGDIDNVSVVLAIPDLKNKSTGNSLVVDHEGRNLYVGSHNRLDVDSGIRGAVLRFTGDKDYNYSIKEVILQRKGRTLDAITLLAKFGFYLAIDKYDQVLMVGAKDDSETQLNSGAIYIVKRDLSLDTYMIKVKQDVPLLGYHYGGSVAISNDASSFIAISDKSQ